MGGVLVRPTALTIAGSDSGGGAGLQADLRTFFACGVHGTVAVTAVTAQNTVGVTAVHELPVDQVIAQLDAIVPDIGVGAAKTGMLASAELIKTLVEALDRLGIGGGSGVPFVVDPVAASMHGDQLISDEALDAIRTELFPRATLVTPNLDEVRLLTGITVHDHATQRAAAGALVELGAAAALVKGGHLRDPSGCLDLLYDGSAFHEFPGPRFDHQHTHGAGDTMAAAITAALARSPVLVDAVAYGKHFVVESVRTAYPLGKGAGPVSGFWRLDGGAA